MAQTTQKNTKSGNESTSAEARPNSGENRGLREIIADGNYTGSEAAWECFRSYARERPEVVALWTFGIGFVLGWKLKIW